MQDFSKIFITGLALFAMFFGTGNIIFPLQLGLNVGDQFLFGLSGFLISGVGLPLLGIYAVSLCGGDYKNFFNHMGGKVGFAFITFILLILGIFVGTPRTAIVTFSTFEKFLPDALRSPYVFNGLYFLIVYWLAKNGDQLVGIIGRFISPIKVISIIALIVFACSFKSGHHQFIMNPQSIFSKGFTMGYGTMDLLGAFFFCTAAYNNLKSKLKLPEQFINAHCHKIMLKSSFLGGAITTIVYAGLVLSTYHHSAELDNTLTENLIFALSMIVFGNFGTVFVCFLIFVASVATASVLSEVTTYYCHLYIFRKKMSSNNCLRLVIGMIYAMSILGFDMVMRIASPILSFLYPAMIIYCMYVICLYKYSRRWRMFKKSINVQCVVNEANEPYIESTLLKQG